MAAIDRGVDPDSAADGVAVKRRCLRSKQWPNGAP
jgi:hypothetical protein